MKKINYYLIILLGIISALNYAPFINFNISKLINILFIILTVINIKYVWIEINSKIILVISIILILIYYGLIYQFSNNVYMNDLYSIILSFVLFIVFSSIEINEVEKDKLLSIISFSVLFITSIYIIIYSKTILLSNNYIDGQYFFKGKNGMGPMISFSTFWFIYIY